MSTEAQVTFSNSHGPSGISQKERIPCNESTMKAQGDRIKKEKENKWCH